MITSGFVAVADARPVATPQFGIVLDASAGASTVQRGSVSLQQATALATQRYRGRVVRAETVNLGGRRVHVIRILGDDGRVRTVRVDAETGNFM